MPQLRSSALTMLLGSHILTIINFSSCTNPQNSLKYRSEILLNLTGHLPSLENILKIYYEICPEQTECNYFSSNVSNLHALNLAGPLPECRCSCRHDCIFLRNCCPGNVYGYLPYTCVNVGIYPDKSGDNVLMINSCPSSYSDRSGTVEKCGMTKSRKECPVTSFATGITYSSADCARCNGDTNVTKWRVNITCARRPPNLFKSADKLDAMLKDYDCQMFYWLNTNGHPTYRPSNCNPRVDKQTINSCNMTGLWQKVDEDIKWACHNLNSHFNSFKNIFCFICNPSAASHFASNTIDTCNKTRPLTHYETALETLCQRQPEIKRLAPFKNVYCMLCNGHRMFQSRFNGYCVWETIATSEYSAQIKVDVKEENVSDIFHILNRYFNRPTTANHTSGEADRVFFNKDTMKSLVASYVTVCGDRNICGRQTMSSETNPAAIPICRPCDCSQYCFENGTCCIDLLLNSLPYTCFASDSFLYIPHESVKALPVVNAAPVKVVDRCVFRDPVGHRLCENNPDETSTLTPFIPIVSQDSKIVYKNIYCFLCNNVEEVEEVNKRRISFDMTLQCNTLLDAYLLPDFRSLMEVASKICSVSFIPHTSHRCSDKTYTDVMQEIDTFTRFEMNNKTRHTYTRCNESGHWQEENKSIRQVCEGTTESILTLPVYKYDYNTYKNFACFICNPSLPEAKLDNVVSSCKNKTNQEAVLQCTKRGRDGVWFPYKNYFCADCNLPPMLEIKGPERKPGETPTAGPSLIPGSTPAGPYGPPSGSFRFLFSIHNDEWQAMESRVRAPTLDCHNNGTWDAILKSCRQLYCDEGRFLENNTCHVISEVAANIAYVVKLKLAHVTKTSDDLAHVTDTSQTLTHVTESSQSRTSPMLHACDICNGVLKECTGRFDNETEFRVTSCNVSTTLAYNKGKIPILGNNSDLHLTLTLEIITTHHLTNVETELIGCLDKTYNFLSDNHRNFSFQSSHLTFIDQKRLKYNTFTCHFDILSNVTRNITGKQFEVSALMLCPQIKLLNDEFEFCNGTGSVFVHRNDLNMTEREFRWQNDSVRICQHDQHIHTRHIPRKQPFLLPYYQMFSRISMFLSLIGLLLTFVTYCIFPVLRTLPGKNIMVLTYNMFLAQACLEFAPQLIFHNLYCIIAGVFLHYFWLSTFFAMHLCSYHMFKIFCLKLFERHSFTFQRSQFLHYVAYVQGAPFVIVVFTIAIHMSLTKGTYTGYGYTKCFLSDIYSLVLAFLVPATFIFLMNIVFFLAVAQKIRSTPNLERSTEKSDFLICVKICAIVGVSYPLQIVDGVMQLSVLSFIATAFNGFQGAYIFMAYVCNKRVFGHYQSLCSRCRAGTYANEMSVSSTRESLPSPTTTTSSQSSKL